MPSVTVDYENRAEQWWAAAREAADAPKPVLPLLEIGGLETVTVSDAEAEAILVWAERLPGWDTGPEYAPNPLLIHEEW